MLTPENLAIAAALAVVVIVVIVLLARRGRGESAKAPAALEAKDRVEAKPTAAKEKIGAEEKREERAAPTKREEKAAPKATEKAEEKAEPKREAPTPETAPAAPPHVEAAPPRPEEPATKPEPALARPSRPGGQKEDVAALKKGLTSTRGGFIARLARMLGKRKDLDPALLDQIEEVLLTADLGPKTAGKLLERLRERLSRNELADDAKVWAALREDARTLLEGKSGPIVLTKKPTVILVVGVNGVGKTTTIGKLASRFTQSGKKVVLAAGDTFRAAAVLQLEVWGKKVGAPVVKGKDNADPGAVIFDAIKRAKDEGADVVLADTAGRLHTKVPLMDELKKVGRTVEKALERPADEVLLVLDATNGQNAIQQAQLFRDALAITGIVLTKLDGTAKGGVVLGIADEHGIPVRYIGIGERVEDLREFDPDTFVEALFERPEEEDVVGAGAA